MEVIVQHTGALLTCVMAVAGTPASPTLGSEVFDLLERSIPTALLFLVVVGTYEILVHKPLSSALTRRRALTEGAMVEAQNAIASAEARAAEYAEKLRLARAEAYKLREQRVKQWNAERDAALDAARNSAAEKVRQAKAALDAETASAQKAIQASVADLAAQAVRAVLPVPVGGTR